MISHSTLICKQCEEERYQKVLFVGTEFAFQCPCCEAIHLFSENIHFDLKDHFNNEPWERYVGYWYKGKMFANEKCKREIVERFEKLMLGKPWFSNKEIQVIKRTNREPNGKYFIASMLHDHFQSSFRALYHLNGFIERKKDTYNILIFPKDNGFDWLLKEDLKLKGIDEIWIVPFSKRMRWLFTNDKDDILLSWEYCLKIQRELDRLEGMGITINKRAGPVPNGKRLLKYLLEPLNPKFLKTIQGKPLWDRYVGVLYKEENQNRAGLSKKEHFKMLEKLIVEKGQKPLLILVTGNDRRKALDNFPDFPSIYVPEVCDQVQLFKEHISFVIGSNCSGCNIPGLYNIPMFVFAKDRRYPDDFYCFGRMASTYDKNAPPWYGKLEKADNIYEQKVPIGELIRIEDYSIELSNWLQKHTKNYSHQFQGKIRLEEGYKDKCPQCGKLNKSNGRILVRSDIAYFYECDCGIKTYFAYYGLTTSSLVAIESLSSGSEEALRVNSALKLREECEEEWLIKQIIQKKKTEVTICFYLLKASIADLNYILPCLFALRRDYPEAKIVTITYLQYAILIPELLVDEFWLLNIDSPYVYHKEIYTGWHKALEKEIGTKPIVSNYPGYLPATKNDYFWLQEFYQKKKGKARVGVTICCRLQSSRQWPRLSILKGLLAQLEENGITYCILVFPKSEKVALEDEWLTLSNILINPSMEFQLQIALHTKVWLAPHGAASTLPCMTNTNLIELETEPPWWKMQELMPIVYGLPFQRLKELHGDTLNDIPTQKIIEAIKELL